MRLDVAQPSKSSEGSATVVKLGMIDGVDFTVEVTMNVSFQVVDRLDDSQERLLVIMRETLTETEIVKQTLRYLRLGNRRPAAFAAQGCAFMMQSIAVMPARNSRRSRSGR